MFPKIVNVGLPEISEAIDAAPAAQTSLLSISPPHIWA